MLNVFRFLAAIKLAGLLEQLNRIDAMYVPMMVYTLK